MEKAELERIKKLLEVYLSTTKLDDVKRQGWVDWKVDRERIESVAEHVFSTSQLAIFIWSEYNVNVNIERVVLMLQLHETEEPVIGDIPLVHDLKKYKKEMGKIAVSSLVSGLRKSEYILNLIKEFEEQQTPESKYAKFIDKLQCDLKSKFYDEENTVDLSNQEGNKNAKDEKVVDLLEKGNTFSQMWMQFGRDTYNYPKEFNDISEYAEENNLHELRDNYIKFARNKVDEYLNNVRKNK